MFVYVLDLEKNTWIETESLFPHDIALLIDAKPKKAYLWFGTHSEESKRDLGQKMAEEIMKKYEKMYELIVLGNSTVLLKVEAEIEQLLGENADISKNKVERTKTMQVFEYGGWASIAMMGVLVFTNMRMLFWNLVNGHYSVNMWSFNDLFNVIVVMAIIVCVMYGVELVLALVNKKVFLIICSAAALAMSIGTTFYLAQGEFIFPFLPGAPQYTYYIRVVDILANIGWLFLVWAASSLPIVYCIFAIRKTTEFKAKETKVISEHVSVKPSLIRQSSSGIKQDNTPSQN